MPSFIWIRICIHSSGSEDGGKEHYIMKKTLMALALSMAVSASCFAAGASSRFAAEEKAADALIAALVGNGTYEQVSKTFGESVKAKISKAEQFVALKNDVKNKIGVIKNPNFVQLAKGYDLQKGYNGVDSLVYLGTITKDKYARLYVTFADENNTLKIVDFGVNLLNIQQKNEAATKK